MIRFKTDSMFQVRHVALLAGTWPECALKCIAEYQPKDEGKHNMIRLRAIKRICSAELNRREFLGA